MLTIKILGPGCANCKRLAYLTERATIALKLEAQIEKVTDAVAITQYPILSTPGLVINDHVVCSGRVPSEAEIKKWLGAWVEN
jgi:small redox-active disulfide protein 2